MRVFPRNVRLLSALLVALAALVALVWWLGGPVTDADALKKNRDLIETARKRGEDLEARHAADLERFYVMKNLLLRESRSREEQDKINQIARDLEKRYGDIGIQWDGGRNAIGLAGGAGLDRRGGVVPPP
jgi:hypothetical protein